MKRSQHNNQYGTSEEQYRRDEFDVLLRRFATPSPVVERSPKERWERLSKRIRAYQQLYTLIGQMTTHGSELRRATLLLRPCSSLLVPFA